MAKQSNFTIANYNAVLEAVKANNGYVVDVHNNRRTPYRAAGIAALVKGDRVVPVLLCNSRYFSVNPLVVEAEGTVALLTNSVGGCVMPHQHDNDLAKAIKAYNDDQEHAVHSSGALLHVRIFDYSDDTAPVFGEPVDLAEEVVSQ